MEKLVLQEHPQDPSSLSSMEKQQICRCNERKNASHTIIIIRLEKIQVSEGSSHQNLEELRQITLLVISPLNKIDEKFATSD